MGYSGHVNWSRLDRTHPWIRNQDRHTSVYAFWPVDYRHPRRDHGVGLFKAQDRHPDWFLHAETADHVLTAYVRPTMVVSPNLTEVFDDDLVARPLLASVLLGTANAVYRTHEELMWWCAVEDLTLKGRLLVTQLSHLYERDPVLVTLVDGASDEEQRSPRLPLN